MKLYITVNRPIPGGYLGLDLSKQKINFDDMDNICEPAECTEIILDEILSYVTIEKLGSLIQKITSRLRKRGKIVVKDVDIAEATKMYHNGLLNVNDLNLLIFGQGNLNKCGAYSVSDVRAILEAFQLETTSIDLNNCYYTLIMKRP